MALLPESFRYFSKTFCFDNANNMKFIIFGDVEGLWKYDYMKQ